MDQFISFSKIRDYCLVTCVHVKLAEDLSVPRVAEGIFFFFFFFFAENNLQSNNNNTDYKQIKKVNKRYSSHSI